MEIELPATFRSVGPTDTLVEVSASGSLTNDEYGLDILTRIYECRRDLLEQHLPRRGDADYRWPDLHYDAHTEQDVPGFKTRLVISYAGLRGGVRRAIARHEVERRLEQVQLVTDTDQTVEVDYYAPVTTFKWVSPKLPDDAKFRGPIIAGPKRILIQDPRPANFTGKLLFVFENVLESLRPRRRGNSWVVDERWVTKMQPAKDPSNSFALLSEVANPGFFD